MRRLKAPLGVRGENNSSKRKGVVVLIAASVSITASHAVVASPGQHVVAEANSVQATEAREVEFGPESHQPVFRLYAFPETPQSGKPLRLLAVVRNSRDAIKLKLQRSSGEEVLPDRLEQWGYNPRAQSAIYENIAAGEYQAVVISAGAGVALASLDFAVSPPGQESSATPAPHTGVWSLQREWTAELEDLFSVFVAKLFYVEPGSRKGWRPLHQATRDPTRNIFYGSLGFDEDNGAAEVHVVLKPDCADAPYLIRAYFAWKMGLPFLFNNCTRGSSITGPRCSLTRGNLTDEFDDIGHPVSRFNFFVRQSVSWQVHAGNARTLPEDNASDFYPIDLEDSALRPGAIYVDTGGHLILVTQREPQSASAMGALFGVDAHPDRTVSHKLFSKGTFVFNHRVPTGGFKAFRPVVLRGQNLAFSTNQEINENGRYPKCSAAQAEMESTEQFYEGVYAVLNPRPVDPREVLVSKVEVLYEAMQERVLAVQLGVDYMTRLAWTVISMPEGASIFETEGPWEVYSTPARDLRCFLALDDVMEFPEKVRNNPLLYDIHFVADQEKLHQELVDLRDRLLKEKTIEYTRSDGSPWTLTLEDLVTRQKDLEMAYNPNDCPETRWAAPKNSEELQTCHRRAPKEQIDQMRLARFWFASRRRPDQR